MADMFEKSAGASATVAVTHDAGRQDATAGRRRGDGGEHDPHVWFDVKLWSKASAAVRDELCELDPARGRRSTPRTRTRT